MIRRDRGRVGTAGVSGPQCSPRAASAWPCDTGPWTTRASDWLHSTSLPALELEIHLPGPSPPCQSPFKQWPMCDTCFNKLETHSFQYFMLKFSFQWVVYLKASNLFSSGLMPRKLLDMCSLKILVYFFLRCGLQRLHETIKNRCKTADVKHELETWRLALWSTPFWRTECETV